MTSEFTIQHHHGRPYLTGIHGRTQLATEQDLLDFVVNGSSSGVIGLLLEEAFLTPAFFDLRTQLAGGMLQKLINYRVKTAVLISPNQWQGHFGELAHESQRSRQIRFFTEREAAVAWLTQE